MGLFDTISFDSSLLPESVLGHSDGDTVLLPVPTHNWQTKDLDCCMDNLHLGADGQLQRQIIDPQATEEPADQDQGYILSPHLPRCWVADESTGDVTCYASLPLTTDPQPHPEFPEARRSWSLRARLRLVAGRLQGSVQVDVDHVWWLESVSGGAMGHRVLITDPEERAQRDKEERLREVLRRRNLVDPMISMRRHIAATAASRRAQAAQLRALQRLQRQLGAPMTKGKRATNLLWGAGLNPVRNPDSPA